MKIILLIISIIPNLSFGQISVKDQLNEDANIIAKVDSTQNFTDYKTASQFLGLVGNKVFALPINPNYDSRYISFDKLKYIAKQKVKTDFKKYNIGELVPVETLDFYKQNISEKYFTIKEIKFIKGFNQEEITSSQWEKEMKFSSSVRGILIVMSDEKKSIDIVSELDGLFSGANFLSVFYFVYLKKKFVNDTVLQNETNRYEIPSENILKYPYFTPKEIKEADVYSGKEILLEQSTSENSRYPNLYLVLKNKTSNNEHRIILNNKFSDKLKYVADYKKYSTFYQKTLDEKNLKEEERKLDAIKRNEEKKENVYRLYSKVVAEKILAGKVELGMDRLAVIYALGYPDDINETITVHGKSEQFVYRNATFGDNYYYFENNKLTAIQK